MTDLTLADESVDLVQQWIDPANARKQRTDPAAIRLAQLLKDPKGLDFTIGFVDRVIRPDDNRVAAHNLRALARNTPAFLPLHLRALVKLGAFFSLMVPGLVVATARRALRRMVGHLIIDARPKKLGKAIGRLRADGDRLNLNLLGEAVLGNDEAARRLAGTRELLEREDVDYVSIKVSAVASQLSMWAFEETVDRVVGQL
ncbi:MAG: 1-pyrroline-5-carboxylate dehydrogenase, partial [Aeromicrobium sp.]